MFNSSPQHYSHLSCRLLELQLTSCNFSCCSGLCSTRTQILCNFPPWVFKLLRVLDGVGVNPRLVANCWQAYVSAEITQDPASMDVTLKCKRPAHLTIGNMLQIQIATNPHIERRFENRLPQFCHQQFWVLFWFQSIMSLSSCGPNVYVWTHSLDIDKKHMFIWCMYMGGYL